MWDFFERKKTKSHPRIPLSAAKKNLAKCFLTGCPSTKRAGVDTADDMAPRDAHRPAPVILAASVDTHRAMRWGFGKASEPALGTNRPASTCFDHRKRKQNYYEADDGIGLEEKTVFASNSLVDPVRARPWKETYVLPTSGKWGTKNLENHPGAAAASTSIPVFTEDKVISRLDQSPT